MKKTIMRAMSLALALAMALPLASCGGKKDDLPEKQTLENVYTTEKLSVDFENDDSGVYFNEPFAVNGEIYIFADDYRSNEDDPQTSRQNKILYKYNSETGKSEEVFTLKGYSKYVDVGGKTEYWDAYYTYTDVDSDGTLWTVRRDYFSSYDENTGESEYNSREYLMHMSFDGSVIAEVDLYDIIPDYENDGFYTSSIVGDVLGGVLICGYSGCYLLDSELSLKNKITFDNDMWGTTTKTGDGRVLFVAEYYDEASQSSKQEFLVLDSDGSKFTALEIPAETNLGIFDSYSVITGPGSTVYYRSNSGMMQLDVDTGTVKEVLNWLNSDINYSRVNNISYYDGERFLMSEYSRDYSERTYSILSPAGEKVEKHLITLASVYLSDNLRDAVIDFNRKNTDYRITFLDYSVYNTMENYEAGIEKLNSDIIANKLPDIIDMSGLDYDTYASKRILADLYKLMDEDTTFDRSEYYENIFEATEYNGKLYSVIPNYSISTLMAREENFGNVTSITMQQLNALLEKYPNASVFDQSSTREQILNNFCTLAVKNYIDLETGNCNFDSDDFRRFLELVKQIPEESPVLDDNYWMDYSSYFRENKVLLRYYSLSCYSDTMYAYNEAGGPVSFVGFPVCEGSGTGAAINATVEIALSASSPYLDVTWQLVKYLLSSEYQSETNDYFFSIRRDRMEELAAKAKEVYNGDDGSASGDLVVYGSESLIASSNMIDSVASEDNDGVYYNKVTQEMIDKVDACIASVKRVSRDGDTDDYKNIISEEAGAFFSGQKSVEDVTAAIQSRIQLMVREQS